MDRLGRWWNATRQAPAKAAEGLRSRARRSQSAAASVAEAVAFATAVRGAWVIHEAAGYLVLAVVLYVFSLGLDPGGDES